MNLELAWPIWIFYSAIIVLAFRVFAVILWSRILSLKSSFIITYGLLPFNLALGLFLVAISGLQMYGFDRTDAGHWFGYIVLFYSPLGIPVIIGAPIALISDLVRRPWRNVNTA